MKVDPEETGRMVTFQLEVKESLMSLKSYEYDVSSIMHVCVLTSERQGSSQAVQGVGIFVEGVEFKLCVCQPVNKHT